MNRFLLVVLLRVPFAALASLSAGQVSAGAADDVSVVVPGPVWNRHAIDASSRGADGVKLGDINGDGWPDMVTGWEEGGEVRLYLNPGPRRAREPWPRVTVGMVRDAEDAVFADLDSDGRLDVVSCTEGQTRTVFWHRCRGRTEDLLSPAAWGSVPFPVTVKSQSWMQAVAMDVDGQHGQDLLLASKNAGAAIGWLQASPSSGSLEGWQYHRLREAGWVMSLTARDLDGDGDLDVLFSDRKGARTGVFWLENPGATANRRHADWREHAIGALGRQVMFADLGDVDADGRVDVAVAVKPADIVLCLQQPGGAWQERTITLDAANIGDAKAAAITDVNGDGLADLVFTCENAKGRLEGIVWLEQQKSGPWQQHPLGGPEGVKFDLLQILDLDADGDPDAITCEERDQLGVVWYENPQRGEN